MRQSPARQRLLARVQGAPRDRLDAAPLAPRQPDAHQVERRGDDRGMRLAEERRDDRQAALDQRLRLASRPCTSTALARPINAAAVLLMRLAKDLAPGLERAAQQRLTGGIVAFGGQQRAKTRLRGRRHSDDRRPAGARSSRRSRAAAARRRRDRRLSHSNSPSSFLLVAVSRCSSPKTAVRMASASRVGASASAVRPRSLSSARQLDERDRDVRCARCRAAAGAWPGSRASSGSAAARLPSSRCSTPRSLRLCATRTCSVPSVAAADRQRLLEQRQRLVVACPCARRCGRSP